MPLKYVRKLGASTRQWWISEKPEESPNLLEQRAVDIRGVSKRHEVADRTLYTRQKSGDLARKALNLASKSSVAKCVQNWFATGLIRASNTTSAMGRVMLT